MSLSTSGPKTFESTISREGLRDRGHEVSVFTGKPNYPEGSVFPGYGFFGRMSETCEGMRVIRVPRLLDSA